MTVPRSVTSIGFSAFGSCSALESITLPFVGNAANADDFERLSGSYDPDYQHSQFGYIFGTTSYEGGTATVHSYWGVNEKKTYYIPSSLKTVTIDAVAANDVAILYGAFSNCTELTSITLNQVTSIGEESFEGCTSLTTITVPQSVTSIARGAFRGCMALETMTLPFPGTQKYTPDMVETELSENNGALANGNTGLECGFLFGTIFQSGNWDPDKLPSTLRTVTFTNCEYLPYNTFHHNANYSDWNITSVTLPNNLITIGEKAFSNCPGLTSITIPSNVTTVDDSAFYKCTGLEQIEFSNGVTQIGSYAFASCTGLTSVTIPESVTSIGGHTFDGCKGLTSVNIPERVTSIAEYMFYDCDGLTSVTIPEGVTSIGNYAFSSCGLTSLTIPEGVTTIGDFAFAYCSDVQEFVFEGETPPTFEGNHVFANSWCPIYVPTADALTAYKSANNMNDDASRVQVRPIEVDGIKYQLQEDGTLAVVANNYSGEVVIPGSIDYNGVATAVTSIGGSAFSGCTGLTSITIPESVISIGGSAFEDCTSLTSISFSEGVTSIGIDAFSGCTGLTSITLPEGVTSIGGSAFEGCKGLTSVTIPESVTSIGAYAFYNCSKLQEFVFEGETPPTFGNNVFSGTNSCPIYVPNASAVTEYKEAGNMNSYASRVQIMPVEIDGVKYQMQENETFAVIANNYSGNVVIRESVDYNGVATAVTSITDGAFQNCTGLTSVTVPEGVTSIGNYAFYGCTGLRLATISSSVTEIGNYAFEYCKSVQEFVFEGETPPTFGTRVFEYTSFPIYAPNASAVTAYKEATNMSSYASRVQIMPITIIVDGVKYQIQEDETFAVVANNYSGDVVIRESVDYNGVATAVTSIGSNAFSDCTGLTSVTIPSSITTINSNAFTSCTNLTKVTLNSNAIVSKNYYSSSSKFKNIFGTQVTEYVLGEDVTTIGKGAFYDCTNLTSVTIPESVTSIEGYAFWSCRSLTTVSIPESVTSIGVHAFQYCSGLTSINIPNNITSISEYTFNGCTDLTSITIPESVTSIGSNAFYGCEGLTSITIPQSVTSISNDAFYVTGLTKVTLNSNAIASKTYTSSSNLKGVFGYQVKEYILGEEVTSIGNYAFYDCSYTSDFVFERETPPAFGTNVFYNTSCPIYVPNASAVDAYKAAENMSSYASRVQVRPIEVDGIKYQIQEDGTLAVAAGYYLGEVVIPESIEYDGVATAVTSIAANAFRNCTGLTSVSIPESVTSIGSASFYGCNNLTSVTTNSDASFSGASLYFIKDGIKYMVLDKNSVSVVANSYSGNVVILENITYGNTFNVTSIGNFAFNDRTGLTSVTIPSSVTSIGTKAFDGCTNLMKVTLNSNAIVSNTNNYNYLSKIFGSQVSEYVLGEDVTSIGNSAFYGCKGLTWMTIPEGVTSIGSSAFSNCNRLASVTIPEGITTIGSSAFSRCSNLRSVTIPESVTSIGSNAFDGCTGLTSITINSNADFSGASLCFIKDGIKYKVLDKNSVSVVANSYSGEVAIPESVTFGDTFNVISIAASAFENCTGLTSVTIPESVTSIGGNSFYGCTGLTSVTIPESVTTIEYRAFYNCSNVQEFIFEGETPPTFDGGIFYGSTCPIYVPTADAVTAYSSARNIRNNYDGRVQLLPIYTITVVANNNEYGTVSEGGTFDARVTPTITISATAADQYGFAYWNEDGNTEASRTITITGNATYTAVFKRLLTISDITVAEKVYDGTTTATVTFTTAGIVESEDVVVDYTATFADANVGEEKEVSFTFSLSGDDKDNYILASETATVKANISANTSVVVTITENSASETYDGTEKTVTGYAVEINSELYKESDFVFNGTAEAKGTNAGEYEMNIAASNFENTNANFADVTFTVVDGKLTIEKSSETPNMPELTAETRLLNITDVALPEGWVWADETIALVEGENQAVANYVGDDAGNYTVESVTITITRLPCLHDGEYTIVDAKEATCTADGYTGDHKCSICGAIFEQGSVIPAEGHKAGEPVVENYVAPTCTEAGTVDTVVYCTIDNEEISRKTSVLPATGHIAGEAVVENYVAPTCTEAGTVDTVYYCTIDGDLISRETYVLEAKGHQPGKKVAENLVPATITSEGSVDSVTYCTVCGEELSREHFVLPILDHEHIAGEPVVENYVAPTCTEAGAVDTVVYCTVNGEELSREHFVLPALGHTAGEPVIENYTAPTCTEAGAVDTVVYCTVNGEELSREHFVLPALGHTAGEAVVENYTAPTCTEAGTVDTVYYCTIDNEEISRETYVLEAKGHQPSEKIAKNYVAPTCLVAGSVDSVVTCTVCGEVLSEEHFVLPALGHTAGEAVVENYTAPTCKEAGSVDTVYYCTIDGEEISRETYVLPILDHVPGEKVAENYVAPTKTEEGSVDSVVYCTIGGEELSRESFVLPAIGHDHILGEPVAENYKAPTCTEAGSVDTVVYCLVEGEELSRDSYVLPALGHKPSEKVAKNYVAPTCLVAGSVDSVITCTICGEVLSEEHFDLPATGHIAGEPVIENYVAPTCTTTGTVDTVYYCTIGGDLISRETYELPALGHKAGEKVAENYVTPTKTEDGSVDSVVYCTICGEELSRESFVLPAIGHDHIFGEPVAENYKAPTCTEAGSVDTVVYCMVEGEELSRETYVLPMLEHVAGEKVAENYVAPTATEEGSVDSVVYCTIGGEELSRESFVLPAIGHDHIFGEPVAENYKAPTCTEAGSVDTVVYCLVDGEELSRETYVLPMLEHVPGEKVAENYVAPTATEEGSVDSVVYCTICGEELSRESYVLPIETTAISDVTADAPSIYAFGHTIVVETTAFIGSDIVVYDINGRIIATASATNERTEINISRVGVYGVRMATISATVMIR